MIVILDTQINMYSVDTGHFYSNHEKYLHEMNCKYRSERNYVNNMLSNSENELLSNGYTLEDIKEFKAYTEKDYHLLANDIIKKYVRLNIIIEHKREKAKVSKEKLLTLLKNKVLNKEKLSNKIDHCISQNIPYNQIPLRRLREEELTDQNIISVFESSLTRSIGIKKDELTDALIVVQIYYFDVFKDISFYGFTYKGEKYRYFTSSAGQIRKKKAVFIKESVWDKVEKTIMCGLTIEKINSKGGNNVNKHLAYMALANSATDQWTDFDIDRCIVVDDFETNVPGTFDFIDESDYSITRKTGDVPIPHTDGAGMMLPKTDRSRSRSEPGYGN